MKLADMEVVDQDFLKVLSDQAPQELKSDFKYYVMDALVMTPIDETGFSGDVYLLVDRHVSSSSETFLQAIRDTQMATVIGEPSTGEHSGLDSILVSLPNSGYVVRFPGAMILNSSGINTKEVSISPDVWVEGPMALEKEREIIKTKTK